MHHQAGIPFGAGGVDLVVVNAVGVAGQRAEPEEQRRIRHGCAAHGVVCCPSGSTTGRTASRSRCRSGTPGPVPRPALSGRLPVFVRTVTNNNSPLRPVSRWFWSPARPLPASPITSGAIMVARPPANIRRRLGMGGRKCAVEGMTVGPQLGCPSASPGRTQCHGNGNASPSANASSMSSVAASSWARCAEMTSAWSIGVRSPVRDVCGPGPVAAVSATHLSTPRVGLRDNAFFEFVDADPPAQLGQHRRRCVGPGPGTGSILGSPPKSRGGSNAPIAPASVCTLRQRSRPPNTGWSRNSRTVFTPANATRAPAACSPNSRCGRAANRSAMIGFISSRWATRNVFDANRRSLRQVRAAQHDLAEPRPFGFVLNRQQDGVPVAGLNGP